MLSAGFEQAIPATRRHQTYALYKTATGIGKSCIKLYDFKIFIFNVVPETF